MSHLLFPNGIDAETGGPIDGDLVITTELIAKVARGHKLTPEDLRDAKLRKAIDEQKSDHFGVAEGIDDTNLAETGWAVIFPASLPQKSVDAIKEALKPLLDLRREQAAARNETFYKEVIGPELGYRNGETKNDFLKRFGRGPGPADPNKFPYYALLVGSPETIPYTFQYQLDVQYAVGRIYFENLEDYYRYAQSVVAAETGKLRRAKRAAFFGVANPDDRATQMSAKSLVQPLSSEMQAQYTDWNVEVIAPEQATKANLTNYLGGKQTPALLFTASHGMNFKPGDPRLLRHTGAILTQDWPGPKARVPIKEDFYFSADDLASDAEVAGMFAFLFACYGGGIPRMDNFYRQAFGEQKQIAPHAFLAPLPLRLLAHPKGGALGVFAHIERAWGASIEWDGLKGDVETFDSTLDALLNGKPAGAAIEYFNQRYAEISTSLTEELDNTSPETQDEIRLAGLWTSNNDARNYAFLGDPAVRLPVSETEMPKTERLHLGEILSKPPASVRAAVVNFQPDVEDRTAAVPGAKGPGSGEMYAISDLFKKPENTPDSPQPTSSNLNKSLNRFLEKLSTYLSQALDDTSSLEVSTYVADDLADVKYEHGKYSGARLRAMTRIELDGDTLVCVPERDGEVDTALWNIHLEMVKSAQHNRAELLKTIVSAAGNLAGLLK
ncbi:MAG: C25 family cysteine peptidase [Anaerolineales bacterium]|nr:C25 family cysteine peptidase [Anaerolineales bacterium]MCX7755798.1 C25 family cysteine peptidase [Anaerolineales bacterium]MDW8279271.1 C25 family cysteine peptidase [Anaerolineales bacterium]